MSTTPGQIFDAPPKPSRKPIPGATSSERPLIALARINWPEKLGEGSCLELDNRYEVICHDQKLRRRPLNVTHFRDDVDHAFIQFTNLKTALTAYHLQRQREGAFYNLFGSILNAIISNETLTSWGIHQKQNKLDAAGALLDILTCIEEFRVPTFEMLEEFRRTRPYMNSGRLGAIFKVFNPRDLHDCLDLAEQKHAIVTLYQQLSLDESHARLMAIWKQKTTLQQPLMVNSDADTTPKMLEQIEEIKSSLETIHARLRSLSSLEEATWRYFVLMNDQQLRDIKQKLFSIQADCNGILTANPVIHRGQLPAAGGAGAPQSNAKIPGSDLDSAVAPTEVRSTQTVGDTPAVSLSAETSSGAGAGARQRFHLHRALGERALNPGASDNDTHAGIKPS
jgi:hypothetical protein